jgi:hypothetical protein
MLKRLAIAVLTLAAPAALLVATVAPAHAAPASNTCNAAKLAADGRFGSLTFSAVEWLQSHGHICGGVDGVVGSCTWAYLCG